MNAQPLEITTPNRYILQGFWIGPEKPECVIIALHGLTSNLFSDLKYLPLVNYKTSLLVFNNRGHDIISKLKRKNPDIPKGYDSLLAGTAHEVFDDCIDDIEGAVQIAQQTNAHHLFLAGHSTGCQKSVYYAAHKNNQAKLTGIILSCPLSDYAFVHNGANKTTYHQALTLAKKLVSVNKPHELLPPEVWPEEILDAQRFISLYTPGSNEEIFTYSHDKKPMIYRKIKIPTLAVFAGGDEYADRSAEELANWFKHNSVASHFDSQIIQNAPHNLAGHEKTLGQIIKKFICSI